MASQQSTVDFILEQITGAGEISARKMFGEYSLYCDGKIVGFVADEQLFIKPTPSGKAHAAGCGEGFPYPGAKPCLLIPGHRWDDREWLTQLVRITAGELAPPKKKAPPKSR